MVFGGTQPLQVGGELSPDRGFVRLTANLRVVAKLTKSKGVIGECHPVAATARGVGVLVDRTQGVMTVLSAAPWCVVNSGPRCGSPGALIVLMDEPSL